MISPATGRAAPGSPLHPDPTVGPYPRASEAQPGSLSLPRTAGRPYLVIMECQRPGGNPSPPSQSRPGLSGPAQGPGHCHSVTVGTIRASNCQELSATPSQRTN
eukprot:629054-Hanusia_phi.AAC.1